MAEVQYIKKQKPTDEQKHRRKNVLMLALRTDPFFRLKSHKRDKIESLDQRLRRKDVVQRLVNNILANLSNGLF